jgi:hypothetical protein
VLSNIQNKYFECFLDPRIEKSQNKIPNNAFSHYLFDTLK